jgi:hypothetical protein
VKDFVTKDYLDVRLEETEGKLGMRLTRLETEVAWLKWLTGAIAVGLLAQLLKTFGVI